MSLYALLILAGLVMFTFWAMILYALWCGSLPGNAPVHPESPFTTRAVSLQILITALCAGFIPGHEPGNSLGWAFFAPILAPVYGLWVWGSHSHFLALPVVAAVAISAAASFAWYRFFPGTPRAFTPSIAVVTFAIGFLAAGQIQFRHAVLTAAEVLQPDCLDSNSFVGALSEARQPSGKLYARAVRGADVYGWSFRTRSFYKLPDSVKRNYAQWLGDGAYTSRFSSCLHKRL